MFWLILAILIAYGLAAVAPLLRYELRGGIGASVIWCFVPVILACPLLIPSAEIGLRAASAFASIDITFKMVDYFRHWADVQRSIVLREYYRFLIPFPVLSAVYPDHKRRLQHPASRWPQVISLVGGTAGFAIPLLAIMALSRMALLRSSFALDHVVMLLIFVVGIESLSRALCGIERLAGFDTHPIIRNAYLSRSVSEFWRRFNYRIHDWLYCNVFEATGGRRAPIRSCWRRSWSAAYSTNWRLRWRPRDSPAISSRSSRSKVRRRSPRGNWSVWQGEAGLRASSRPMEPRSSLSPSRPSSSSTVSAGYFPSSMPAGRHFRRPDRSPGWWYAGELDASGVRPRLSAFKVESLGVPGRSRSDPRAQTRPQN